MKIKKPTILITTVIEAAQESVDLIKQWADMRHYDIAFKYNEKAEALIELLEIKHCGSVGGFGEIGNRYQQNERDYVDTLQGRLDWLKEAFKI